VRAVSIRARQPAHPRRAPDQPNAAAAEATGAAAPRAELRPAEALWLAGVGVIMVFSWSSLLTAHLGVLSVGSVTGVALALGAAWLALVAVAIRRGGRRPALAGPWAEVASLAVLAALLAALYLPGFPYGVSDKDPGVYLMHGFSIARTGDIRIHDDALARQPSLTLFDPPSNGWPGNRFPGIWIHDPAKAEVIPQFYHLYPATLGFLGRLSGQTAMVDLNALLAVVSALGVYLLGRRLAGPLAGLVAAVTLGVNMMQVWQAKYPTTEISTQLWFVLGMLALVIAIQTGWWAPAMLAGTALGVAWLDRVDSLLPVLIGLGVLAVVFALGRWRSLHTAFAAGLAMTVPHALYQAFGPARRYTEVAGQVTGARLALVVGCLALAAVVGRLLLRGPLGRRAVDRAARLVSNPRHRLALKALLPAGLTLLTVLAWLRPQLFGPDFMLYSGRVIRSYNEDNLRRLSWFITVPGLLAALAGFALVALRRWQAAMWVAIGPAVAMLVFYAYQSGISPRLMWWTRRYVPLGLLALALLIGIACAAAMAWRGPGRVLVRGAGLAIAALVAVTGLLQDRPLARHQEYGDSFAASARIVAAAGSRQGVFVWDRGARASALLPTPVWLQRDQLSLLLPTRAEPADLAEIRRAFPGQPVFVVTGPTGLPPGLRPAGLTRVDAFRVGMPFWEQSNTHRPGHNRGLKVDIQIWAAR
jgi:4-amino-4-deoxy-L-arabinose transferase-like glycosyltransferase